MIDIFKRKLDILKSTLTDKQLKDVHYQSIYNFLEHFHSFKSEPMQAEISNNLAQYFNEIEEKNYELTKSESNALYDNYLMRIGTYYNSHLNFKVYMEPKWALFISLHVDLILFIFGVLKRLYYIPIATLFFTGYFLYLHVFYKKRNKVYGPRI